jgi:hypothetical protein
MNKMELKKRIAEETQELPDEVLKEVLDFIQFLKLKKLTRKRKSLFEQSVSRELSNLDNFSLTHLEEEFADYKERYPHEK